MEINRAELDRYITGNYGEDQFAHVPQDGCAICGDAIPQGQDYCSIECLENEAVPVPNMSESEVMATLATREEIERHLDTCQAKTHEEATDGTLLCVFERVDEEGNVCVYGRESGLQVGESEPW